MITEAEKLPKGQRKALMGRIRQNLIHEKEEEAEAENIFSLDDMDGLQRMIRDLPFSTDEEIVQKVNSVIRAGMTLPENQNRIHQQGMIVSPMDADTYQAFVAHEALRWKPVILKAGLKME